MLPITVAVEAWDQESARVEVEAGAAVEEVLAHIPTKLTRAEIQNNCRLSSLIGCNGGAMCSAITRV
jgi:hypothetical protein